LQKTLGFTALYVTHDQSEALAMSSSIAVMREGAIEQLGTPEESYDYPRTRFVAAFLGSANLQEGRVVAVRDAGSERGAACFGFEVEMEWGAPVTAFGRVPFAVGELVTVAVRPEGVKLASSDGGRDHATDPWAGVVETVQFLGDAVEYRLRIRDRILRARCDRGHQFNTGQQVFIDLRAKACTVVTD